MTRLLHSTFLSRLITLFESWMHYGNPIEILWQRLRQSSLTEFCIVDRLSGVVCRCRPAAQRMFGEVWFDRDYDVPGLILRQGDLVLDIGGNQGFFACYAAWRGCDVLTFEPDAENVRLLRSNLEANGFTKRVKIVQTAVKATVGEVRLFRTDRLGGGMNTTIAQFAKQFGFDAQESVQVLAVDLPSAMKAEAIERVRLCKMDCEGAELEIVETLTAAEMERIDAFAVEFHRDAYSPDLLVAALERWGTHHVFPAASKSYCHRDILYALSKKMVREILRTPPSETYS
jgi:FkbM family methyltransferase